MELTKGQSYFCEVTGESNVVKINSYEFVFVETEVKYFPFGLYKTHACPSKRGKSD